MASITTRANGGRFITFTDGDGKVRTVTLGKVPLRHAQALKVRVEDLASAKLHGHSPSDDTSRWLAGLDDRVYAKLAAAGLVPERETLTLADWLERYLSDRKDEVKFRTLWSLENTRNKLVGRPASGKRPAVQGFFAPATPLRQVTAGQAADWRKWLRAAGLSEASIRGQSGNAKSMMMEATRRKLIPENPFQYLKAGPVASAYTRYVTPAEIDGVIDALPNAEWRLLFGLARYAGLRVSSETHALAWGDVDWQRGRLTVRSPKTARFAGHESRLVPIVPKLMALLQARFDESPEGTEQLITIRGRWNFGHVFRAACARAGVEPWLRPWQTLRQSAEKEWAMSFPQFAVSKWIGHSITVSGRHYTDGVPDELFDKAAADGGSAQRQAQRQAPQTTENNRKAVPSDSRTDERKSSSFHNLPERAAKTDAERYEGNRIFYTNLDIEGVSTNPDGLAPVASQSQGERS